MWCLTELDNQEVDVGMAADIGTLARIGKIVASESAVRELAFTSRTLSASGVPLNRDPSNFDTGCAWSQLT